MIKRIPNTPIKSLSIEYTIIKYVGILDGYFWIRSSDASGNQA